MSEPVCVHWKTASCGHGGLVFKDYTSLLSLGGGVRWGGDIHLFFFSFNMNRLKPSGLFKRHLPHSASLNMTPSRSVRPPLLSVLQLLHPVEGAASLEPLDLCLVEGVVEGDGLRAAVAVLDDGLQRISWSKVLEAFDGEFVIWANLVVVGRVGKGQREQALLL